MEGWPPNVPVARSRLEPLGVAVSVVAPAPANVEQAKGLAGGALPFPDSAFHLVTSRHEAYLPYEVFRILTTGGTFLTQQVGSGVSDEFYRLFDAPAPKPRAVWNLAFAVRQLKSAGFVVEAADEGFEIMTFDDVGALAWYLKNVHSVYPGFSIDAARATLGRLHHEVQQAGPIRTQQPLFWLKARKT